MGELVGVMLAFLALVLPAAPRLVGPTAAPTQVLFSDDFESYAAGIDLDGQGAGPRARSGSS